LIAVENRLRDLDPFMERSPNRCSWFPWVSMARIVGMRAETFNVRKLIGPLLVALVLSMAGCGRTQPARTASARVQRQTLASRCRLKLRYGGSSAATQHVVADIGVRNLGPARCRIDRYPQVRLIGVHDRTLRLPQGDGNNSIFPPTRVVRYLNPGADAGFGLVFDPLAAGGYNCPSARTAVGMVVTFAPHVQARLDGLYHGLIKGERAPIDPCGGFDVSRVSVG
jgi:hypothetical protein